MTSVLTDQFVATKNVAHFEAELKVQTDPLKRRVLEGLLADEKAKLVALAQDAQDGQR